MRVYMHGLVCAEIALRAPWLAPDVCIYACISLRSCIAGAPATEHACQLIADVALVAIISELVPELYMDAPQNELMSSMN